MVLLLFLKMMSKPNRVPFFKNETEKEARRFFEFIKLRDLENLSREQENKIFMEYLKEYYNDIEKLREFNKTVSDFGNISLLDLDRKSKLEYRTYFIVDVKPLIIEQGRALLGTTGGKAVTNDNITTKDDESLKLEDNDYITDSEYEPSFYNLNNLDI